MVKEIYRISTSFPPEEKFALTQQLRRAALSVFLNIAEGYSRSSAVERKQFFERNFFLQSADLFLKKTIFFFTI